MLGLAVDVASGRVTVDYDAARVSPSEIAAKLDERGYSARVVAPVD